MALRIYFDLCAIKRGWDDAAQLRIRLEADAVGSLLELALAGSLDFVHSAVQDAENLRNPDFNRRAAVEELMGHLPIEQIDSSELRTQIERLGRANLTGFDAAHVAAAMLARADVLVTTDDRLRSRAARVRSKLRVLGPVELAAEVVL